MHARPAASKRDFAAPPRHIRPPIRWGARNAHEEAAALRLDRRGGHLPRPHGQRGHPRHPGRPARAPRALAEGYGWRSALYLVGGAAVATVPLSLLLVRERPSDLGLPRYGAPAGDPGLARRPGNPAVLAVSTLARASRSRDFWLLAGTGRHPGRAGRLPARLHGLRRHVSGGRAHGARHRPPRRAGGGPRRHQPDLSRAA